MNLKKIQEIVNSGYPGWEYFLLEELAKDKNVIPTILEILHNEREEKRELILDLNLQLSRAHVYIRNPVGVSKEFIDNEITKFYNEGRIGHCFANMDKPLNNSSNGE